MFIQTEATPNPATLKFLPGQPVMPSGSADFPSREGADASPLANRLFEVDGARLLLFRQPGAEMFASTRAWIVPAEAAGTLEALPPDDELEAAGFSPLGGIDTFWYNWAAVNEDSEILR